MNETTGKLLLLGSGETSHAGGQAFEALIRESEPPVRIRILETPAGFELNSEKVAGRVGDFMKVRLQNYQPEIQLIPARRKDGQFSTESSGLCEQLADADMIFLGPGSPSYTIRQLAGSRIWQTLQAAFLQGANIALASAATIAFGKHALPVYEIYKVGEDPYWNLGLNFLALFGLEVSFIPHWNNSDGGIELDTSRCFIGRERFEQLSKELPPQQSVIGLDEQTGLILDFAGGTGRIVGKGQVHLWVDGKTSHYSEEHGFELGALGVAKKPDRTEIPSEIWAAVEHFRTAMNTPTPLQVPDEIQFLVEERQQSRRIKDWATSDKIRDQLTELGWQVIDTPDGAKIEPIS